MYGRQSQAANQAATMCNNVLKYDWPRYRYSKTLGAGAFGEVKRNKSHFMI
jgi:hypothetical protein